MRKSLLSGNTIYLLLLAMKGFDAIRPAYNCFISMIISVDTLCGFAPLVSKDSCYMKDSRKYESRRNHFMHDLHLLC